MRGDGRCRAGLYGRGLCPRDRLLHRGLRRDGVVTRVSGWPVFLVRVVVANVAMIAAIAWLDRPLAWWLENSVWDRSLWLAVVVSGGVLVYFGALLLAGGRPSQLRHHAG